MSSELVCIIDKSGSMGNLRQAAIDGFNQFLKEQKEVPDDNCRLTLVLFNHGYQVLYDSVDIDIVKDLDYTTYKIDGTTALYDAMGRTLTDLVDRLQKEYTEPPRVAVMVMTDGQENASKDYKKDQITDLVDRLKKDGWQFVFLSSDLQSFATEHTLGANAVYYDATLGGNIRAYNVASSNIKHFRASGLVNTSTLDIRSEDDPDKK